MRTLFAFSQSLGKNAERKKRIYIYIIVAERTAVPLKGHTVTSKVAAEMPPFYFPRGLREVQCGGVALSQTTLGAMSALKQFCRSRGLGIVDHCGVP